VIEGRVAVLECNASGEPTPVITWVGCQFGILAFFFEISLLMVVIL
jgi:hypothetical protein